MPQPDSPEPAPFDLRDEARREVVRAVFWRLIDSLPKRSAASVDSGWFEEWLESQRS